MNGIDGKTIVITGASSGIGAVTARLLAERGAIVVLCARRAGRLDDIAREIRECGGAALTCPTDVTAAMTWTGSSVRRSASSAASMCW